MAKKQTFSFSSPLIYVILGALLVIFKPEMIDWALKLASIFFVVTAIIDFVERRVTTGIINLVIGIILVPLGGIMFDMVLRVLGVVIAAKGVMDLIVLLKHKRTGVLAIVFAAVIIAIGVTLAVSPLEILETVMDVAGILLIVDGILGLIGIRSKK